MLQNEYALHKMCINYIESQYPHLYFYSDLNGVRVTPGTAGKIKAIQMKDRKWLDIFFPEPRHGYSGLFIELKDGYDVLYTKKQTRRKSEHLDAQEATINAMREKGFLATFCTSFDYFKELVDFYFSDDLEGLK